MKKITLLAFLMGSAYGFAQDSCASALAVSPGLTVVAGIDGEVLPAGQNCWTNPGSAAEWFSYTSTETQLITISTAIDENPFDNDVFDTRLSIYTGTCDGLVCENGNDDVSGTDYRSELQFQVLANTTYYFTFDDRWLSTGFTFSLTVDEVFPADCSVSLPFTEDFESVPDFYGCYSRFDLDGNGGSFFIEIADLDGDGTTETFATNSPNINEDKDDWIFSPGIPVSANGSYTVSVKYAGYNTATNTTPSLPVPANESFEIVWADSPSPEAENMTVVGSYSDIVQQATGVADVEETATVSVSEPFSPGVDGTYYMAFHATTIASGAFLLFFEYTITEALGVNDASASTVSMYPNPTKSFLNLSFNGTLDSVEIFDLLGNKVISQKVNASNVQLNVSGLATGTYVIKTQSAQGTQVSKFVKS